MWSMSSGRKIGVADGAADRFGHNLTGRSPFRIRSFACRIVAEYFGVDRCIRDKQLLLQDHGGAAFGNTKAVSAGHGVWRPLSDRRFALLEHPDCKSIEDYGKWGIRTALRISPDPTI
jgi:hypothetical protein